MMKGFPRFITILEVIRPSSVRRFLKRLLFFHSPRSCAPYLFNVQRLWVPCHSSFFPLPQSLYPRNRGKGMKTELRAAPRESIFSTFKSSFKYFFPQSITLLIKTLAILTFLFSVSKTNAQDTGSGLDFLNIGPSSRMLSISEAATAANIGPSAIYSNPSLLALEDKSSLDVGYTLWIANVNNQFAAVNFKTNSRAFAFGVYSSGSSGFEARERPGPAAGEFSIRYLSLSGAIAQQLGPFSIGVAGQYLREEVFQFRASGYAFNAGFTTSLFGDKIRAAAAVKNLGNMESLDQESTPLPSSFRIGALASLIQFTTPGNNEWPVLVSLIADWSAPIEENPSSDFIENSGNEGYFSLAMDVNIGDLLFVQSGYRWGPTERPLSFGVGLSIEPVRVHYALVPFSTGFGTVHSFGVQYYF